MGSISHRASLMTHVTFEPQKRIEVPNGRSPAFPFDVESVTFRDGALRTIFGWRVKTNGKHYTSAQRLAHIDEQTIIEQLGLEAVRAEHVERLDRAVTAAST